MEGEGREGIAGETLRGGDSPYPPSHRPIAARTHSHPLTSTSIISTAISSSITIIIIIYQPFILVMPSASIPHSTCVPTRNKCIHSLTRSSHLAVSFSSLVTNHT